VGAGQCQLLEMPVRRWRLEKQDRGRSGERTDMQGTLGRHLEEPVIGHGESVERKRRQRCEHSGVGRRPPAERLPLQRRHPLVHEPRPQQEQRLEVHQRSQ